MNALVTTESSQCKHARYALASARAGIEHIQANEPNGHLALFMSYGLLANTRHIFHALMIDAKASALHREVIRAWAAESPSEMRRFRSLVVGARNLLLKEFVVPVPSVRTSNFRQRSYHLNLNLDLSEADRETLSPREIRNQELTAVMAESIGRDGSKFRKSVYLDVITLCDDALKTWSEQLDRIEAQVAEAIGRSAL